ncbi:hypothetical protein, partial [Streptobacillus moniliformis]
FFHTLKFKFLLIFLSLKIDINFDTNFKQIMKPFKFKIIEKEIVDKIFMKKLKGLTPASYRSQPLLVG